ncbi:MAG: HEAT repeat domain-containing protein [Pirellulaceae bacterium]|nr:HEAT repeat domain-containing protein [Planctomycetales bacterium]
MMIGAPPGWVLLLILLGLVLVGLVYLLHVLVLIVALRQKWKRRQVGPQTDRGWSLSSFLVVTTLTGTTVGLDIGVPLQRAREAAELARLAAELPRIGADEFFAAAQAGDPDALVAARNKFIELQVQYSHAESVYLNGLSHPDRRVQVETARLFGRFLSDDGRHTLTSDAEDALLAIVGDPQADIALRQEAVASILPWYEDQRRPLYATLTSLGPGAAFAVPQLAEFLVDRSHRHWQMGGDFDAPVGAVRVLRDLGPLAHDALPQLEQAISHSNEWEFVPAVVEAIGAIGQREALPLLERTANSTRSEVRTAAEEAIDRIKHQDH